MCGKKLMNIVYVNSRFETVLRPRQFCFDVAYLRVLFCYHGENFSEKNRI